MAYNFAEIDKTLERLRTSYDRLAEQLPKAVYLKRTFEDRYLESLKKKINLKFFLKGEDEFLHRLMVEAEVFKKRAAAYKERNEGGFAEGILQEIKSGLAKYPTLSVLDRHCLTEVSRLYGAVQQFLENYWEGISHYIRCISPDMGVKIDQFERSLTNVYSTSRGRLPKFIDHYNEMVRMAMGTRSQRIRAGQEAIKSAGTWLNELQSILDLGIKNCPEDSLSQDIWEAHKKLSDIINDFRLQAFAKRKA